MITGKLTGNKKVIMEINLITLLDPKIYEEKAKQNETLLECAGVPQNNEKK